MFFNAALLLLPLLSGAATARRNCGVTEIPESAKIMAQQMAAEAAANSNMRKTAEARTLEVPMVFHVLHSGNTLEQGNIPDSMLNAQLQVLNDDFASTGISFKLVNTTRTLNATWFSGMMMNNVHEVAMRRALHQGDYRTLNVYFAEPQGFAGWCTFPETGATDVWSDGCVVSSSTMPGGSASRYNLGRTLTHEVGHWFNLFHTFEGGCSDVGGDFVADTPAEKAETFGCPISQDSCPGLPGVDPIHNFMDYTDDDCMEQFTPGQGVRMIQSWDEYRANA